MLVEPVRAGGHGMFGSHSEPIMRSCHVLIIGAGIGGLTAALSLQRHGAKVSIFERASRLGEIGAGLVVTPNAMHALAFLGVAEAIAATSILSDALEIRDYRSGRVLRRRPPGDAYVTRYGAGHFQVHRADLHNALSTAVLANDPDCVHLDRTFIDLTQDRNCVVARFADGSVARGEALIGCDGGRSTVREVVFGSAPAGYTGQVSFRALVPAARLPEGL